MKPWLIAISLYPLAMLCYVGLIARLKWAAQRMPEGPARRIALYEFKGKAIGVVCIMILTAWAVLVITAPMRVG